MPPFQTLATDEERERKAELHQPGTYHVIANPSSFASLPEYRDGQSMVHFEQDGNDETPGISRKNLGDNEDSNTVILQTFEDTSRRGSINSFRLVASPPSPVAIAGPPTHRPHYSHEVTTSRHSSTSQQNASKSDLSRYGGRDAGLLEHYEMMVAPRILKRERSNTNEEEDIFETEARTYPPVRHYH